MAACACMTFSTEGIPVHQKAEGWAAALREALGIDCVIEAVTAQETFEQSLTVWQLGDVLLAAREGSALRTSWLASQSSMAFADINLDGHCIRQHGRHPEILMEPRSICLYPVADGGSIFYPEAARRITLAFPRTLLTDCCPDWEQQAACVLPADGGAAGMLLDMANSLLRNAAQLGNSCRRAAGHMLLKLLGAALGAAEKGEDATESSRLRAYHRLRIRQFVLAHLANPHLTVNHIARAVGLSPRYLHSLFTDEPLRLMQWVQEQRLERCRIGLATAQENLTITRIAYANGFNDAAHFSRAFRKRFGLSPREFQENARRASPLPQAMTQVQQHF